MNTAKRHFAWVTLTVLATLASAAAQEPRVANAKLQKRSAAAGLEKEFRALISGQVEPAWIGYAVPMIAGEHHMCCYESWSDYGGSSRCCGGCRLEMTTDGMSMTPVNRRVELEALGELMVLFRVEQKRVEKIRTFSQDCELDAGGLPFYWLTDARPSESVALLASFVTSSGEEGEGERRVGHGALAAIAFHADPAADRALEQFVAPTSPDQLRERAAFWLGSARGRAGYEILRRMVREDPSDRVRDKAVFALSVSKAPEAVDTLISVARDDKSSHVRGQAIFWLAHKAGRKAASAITEAIENDPETSVKKRAVFALSQLPKDEGLPKLIEVARNNHNPAVRKQAMFWLGQSHDPRALAFFEEVLKSSDK